MVRCPSLRRQTTEMIAGMTPMRTSLKLNLASSAVMTMSEAPTSPRPPAKACAVDAWRSPASAPSQMRSQDLRIRDHSERL